MHGSALECLEMGTSGADADSISHTRTRTLQRHQDPITQFLQCLYVRFDFDGAQEQLQACYHVLRNDYFLSGCVVYLEDLGALRAFGFCFGGGTQTHTSSPFLNSPIMTTTNQPTAGRTPSSPRRGSSSSRPTAASTARSTSTCSARSSVRLLINLTFNPPPPISTTWPVTHTVTQGPYRLLIH